MSQINKSTIDSSSVELIALQQVPTAPEEEDNAHPSILLQYWQAVLRWRVVIAGIIVGSVVIGFIVTLLTSPLFTARAQIEVSREQKNVTNVQGLETGNEARDLEFYATQYALLKAESLAERVARKLKLAESEVFLVAHGTKPAKMQEASARTPQELQSLTAKAREREVVGLLLRNLEVAPIRTSRLIDIKYTSRSPVMSARIANAWSQEFISATMDRGFASTADARHFLEERLAQLKQKVEESEREVVAYTSGNGIVTLDTTRDAEGRTFTQRTLASAELEGLSSALVAARAERIEAASRAMERSADNSPEALTNPAITGLRAQRAQAAAEYAKLMVQFEPGYPAARALKQQMDALDSAIAREIARVSGSRRVAFVEALRKERDLEAKVASLKQELNRQKQASIQQNIFQREADTNRQLYDALLQRYKEIGIAGTVGASNIAIVDAAKVPTAPSSPNMALNLALSLLVGIGLAALAVLSLEQIDEGIRNPDDVRNFLKIPLLGNVPNSEQNPLKEIENPKSQISEAYFSIRSTLVFTTNHGLPRSFLVTSTQPGEGKSTTSVALAEIIGRTGKSVLLIDGDLRSPSLHRYLGLENQEGLSNLLAGDAVNGQIRETAKRGLSVVTTGPMPPGPAELLSSERFGELIAIFLEHYDHVVIDAPPILGLADSPLMGRAVEGVVYVAEAERTSRRAIRSSLQRLRSAGAHVFGLIVTKIDYTKHSYGYGYGYCYGYGYGSRYGEE